MSFDRVDGGTEAAIGNGSRCWRDSGTTGSWPFAWVLTMEGLLFRGLCVDMIYLLIM
jgi:hypothetical protein